MVTSNKYVVSIQNHAELTKAITAFVKEHNLKAGTISGLGAINEATLRFFDPATKKYVDKTFTEQMEISNLTGNISQQDGKPYIHLHVTLGRDDYTALAGHLLTATISGAGEFVIDSFEGTVNRYHDENIGLNLYQFNMSKLRIIATVTIKPEYKAEALDVLHTVADASRKEEGNISYVLHEDINNSSKVIILEEWKSQEAIDFHNQTEHFSLLKTKLEKMADNLTIEIIRESY